MDKYKNAKKIKFSLEKLGSGLALLLLFIIAFFLVSELSNIDFYPPEHSVELSNLRSDENKLDNENKAKLYINTSPEECLKSIDKYLPKNITGNTEDNSFTAKYEEIYETFQNEFFECIKKTEQNYISEKKLPHKWSVDKDIKLNFNSGAIGILYKINFPITNMPEIQYIQGHKWDIVLTGVNQNAIIFVNKKLLNKNIAKLGAPYPRNHSKPMKLSFQENLLKEGGNEFYIYVLSETPMNGFLSRVYIDRQDTMDIAYDKFHFKRVTIPNIIISTTAILSVLFLLLSFLYKNTEYLFIGLTGLFWSIYNIDQLVVNIPLSTFFWDKIISTSFGFLALCCIFFIRCFLKKQNASLEKVLLLGTALITFGLWLLPHHFFYFTTQYIWNPLVLLGLCYALFLVILQMFDKPHLKWHALTFSMMIITLLAAHDQMISWGLLSNNKGKLFYFGALPLFLAFTWELLLQFRGFLHLARQNSEKNYEMIRLLGEEQVLQEEKARIIHDMHDLIGVYLSNILRQLDHDQLNHQTLRDSTQHTLVDLRLIIDSLSLSNDLPTTLGVFRTRITDLLQDKQIKLDWNVKKLPPVDDFGPEFALDLLRILQEAVNNILKHAQANRISLSVRHEICKEDSNAYIKIAIKDNGKGFSVNNATLGNGLKNIQQQAQRIGAKLTIEAVIHQGTCITLRVPTHAESY